MQQKIVQALLEVFYNILYAKKVDNELLGCLERGAKIATISLDKQKNMELDFDLHQKCILYSLIGYFPLSNEKKKEKYKELDVIIQVLEKQLSHDSARLSLDRDLFRIVQKLRSFAAVCHNSSLSLQQKKEEIHNLCIVKRAGALGEKAYTTEEQRILGILNTAKKGTDLNKIASAWTMQITSMQEKKALQPLLLQPRQKIILFTDIFHILNMEIIFFKGSLDDIKLFDTQKLQSWIRYYSEFIRIREFEKADMTIQDTIKNISNMMTEYALFRILTAQADISNYQNEIIRKQDTEKDLMKAWSILYPEDPLLSVNQIPGYFDQKSSLYLQISDPHKQDPCFLYGSQILMVTAIDEQLNDDTRDTALFLETLYVCKKHKMKFLYFQLLSFSKDPQKIILSMLYFSFFNESFIFGIYKRAKAYMKEITEDTPIDIQELFDRVFVQKMTKGLQTLVAVYQKDFERFYTELLLYKKEHSNILIQYLQDIEC